MGDLAYNYEDVVVGWRVREGDQAAHMPKPFGGAKGMQSCLTRGRGSLVQVIPVVVNARSAR